MASLTVATAPRNGARMDGDVPHPPYTTRLQKGGALVGEMRALLLSWRPERGTADDLVARNVLGHGSQARARDVINRTFIPRFVRSHPTDLWRTMVVFERAAVTRDVTLALHFHLAAESEPLLADCAAWLHADRPPGAAVSVDEIVRFMMRAPSDRFPAGRWTETVSRKVARGLLAALRDFGHLRGASRKALATPLLPPVAFAWIAAHRAALGARGLLLLRNEVWSRFGLGERAVERLFLECHARDLLQYHAGGSVVRVTFPTDDLEAYARVLTQDRARTA